MSEPAITVTVCATCPLGQTSFHDDLQRRLRALSGNVDVRQHDCMSGCNRPSTVAIRCDGKTAYLFGDLEDTDLPLIETFVALYRESHDGDFADARILGDLRFKAIARIPG